MAIMQTHSSLSACQDDHEHVWRGIDAEAPEGGWAVRCEVCHRTLAGLEV